MKLTIQILLFLWKYKPTEDFASYNNIYNFFPDYKKPIIRGTLKYLINQQKIKREQRMKINYFNLDINGLKQLTKIFTVNDNQNKIWSGDWLIIIFDIPEIDRKLRQAIRQKLIDLKFGRYTNSLYLSPKKPINELINFINLHDLTNNISIFEAKNLPLESKKLALKIWPITEINDQYLKFLSLASQLEDGLRQKFNNKMAIIKLWQLTREQYFMILEKDPVLPKELLPKDWLAEEAKRLFNKISKDIIEFF